MRKIKAEYIFGGVIALKKLMSGSSKFGIDLYWNLFDYALEIYKANDKINVIRQEIIKEGSEEGKIGKLEKLSNKEFEINFDIPIIKRSQIDTRQVSPDDLAVLVNNQLIKIEKDEIKEKDKIER